MARRKSFFILATNEAGTLVGVVSMIPEFGSLFFFFFFFGPITWISCEAAEADRRSQGSRRKLVTLVALARDQRPQVRLAAALT